jgi:hypothetical protein
MEMWDCGAGRGIKDHSKKHWLMCVSTFSISLLGGHQNSAGTPLVLETLLVTEKINWMEFSPFKN